jgi:SAM-dependent methyltransferase
MRMLLVLLLLVGACAKPHSPTAGHPHRADPGGHPSGGSAHHRFEDAERWAAHFEREDRDEWQKPEQVIAALRVPEEGVVADIGSATGYFPVRIARAYPSSRIYGVDIEPDMARYLGERARREGLTNLHPVLAAPDDPKLPEPVDRVLTVDTYHHIEERPAYFRRLAGALRPGALLVVVDFKKGSPMGPRDEHKLSEDQVVGELQPVGYRLTARQDLPHQYLLVFELAP